MPNLGDGELLKDQHPFASIRDIALGDAKGAEDGPLERWIAVLVDAQESLSASTTPCTLETITWKYLVTLDFVDVEDNGDTVLGGRILQQQGSPTTVLMPQIKPGSD